MNNTVKRAIKTITGPFQNTSSPDQAPPALTRRQRRVIDRIKAESQQTYRMLTGRFLEYLLGVDLVSKDEAEQKATTLSAQWITYCRQKGLNESAHDLVADYCKKTFKRFFEVDRVKL